MFSQLTFIVLLVSFAASHSFGQVEEKSVDFNISPALILEGEIHVAYEWATPKEFIKRNLSVTDTARVHALHPGKNHLVVSKVAFISKKSFDELNYQSMNKSEFISKMLNSVAVKAKSADTWSVTNKVKAYGVSFNVTFDLQFNEVSSKTVPAEVVNYLRDEGSALKGTHRERILILDMTNFGQLMYRNWSYIYIKEISPKETIIVASVIAGFNIESANLYFNFPPFSTAKGVMLNNMREQILQMARSIQSAGR